MYDRHEEFPQSRSENFLKKSYADFFAILKLWEGEKRLIL
jgi:hypothetical protein